MFEIELGATKSRLLNHPLYKAIESMDDLRIFMEAHVFAVWNFMSLVKRLQQDLTSTGVPWFPASNGESARFINAINLVEESDIGRDGRVMSHLQMYLEAMEEVDANIAQFTLFIDALNRGHDLNMAVVRAQLDYRVANFVRSTLHVAMHGSLEEVVGYFLFGRDDAIPGMFQSLLQAWQIDEQQAPGLVDYLNRHIELDEKNHGPMAEGLLQQVIDNDPLKRQRALLSAIRAMESRIELWDSIYMMIQLSRTQPLPEGFIFATAAAMV